MKKKDSKNRRKFLKYTFGAGLGTLIGAPLISNSFANDDKPLSGDKIKLLTTDGKVIEVDKGELKNMASYAHPAMDKEARIGLPNRKFVMVIDLSRCKNARACVESCQYAHQLRPEQEFMKVLKMQDTEKTAPYWMPKPCFHCDNATCVDVCPVYATYKRDDGLVLVDSDRCIGCKYCMVACPYEARVFHWKEPFRKEEFEGIDYSPETSVPVKQGTVGKCDFCPDLARNGKLPYCATACPEGVIYFGDYNEDTVTNGYETHRLSELIEKKSAYRYLPHYGTEPNVYYLPPVDRIYPFDETKNS